MIVVYDSSSKDISVYLDVSLKLKRSKRRCLGRDSWLVGFRVNLELVKHSGGYKTDTSVQATDTFNGLVLLGKSQPETIDFPMKKWGFPVFFPTKPIHWHIVYQAGMGQNRQNL